MPSHISRAWARYGSVQLMVVTNAVLHTIASPPPNFVWISRLPVMEICRLRPAVITIIIMRLVHCSVIYKRTGNPSPETINQKYSTVVDPAVGHRHRHEADIRR
ncbi:hypothetical protein F5B21DRAFT_482817 [Xylaria acuta]|nr:hypothetical protein F5B21DRAFT_482817 [Xylaria acuta]